MPKPPNTVTLAGQMVAEWDVPFTLHHVTALTGTLHIAIQVEDLDVARAYFAANPIALASGRVVPLRLVGVRAVEWTSMPIRRPDAIASDVPPGLIGMDVQEAAGIANGAGWFVRAHEPEATTFLSYSPGQLNLLYDEHQRVVGHRVG